jgi:hypothetical protein
MMMPEMSGVSESVKTAAIVRPTESEIGSCVSIMAREVLSQWIGSRRLAQFQLGL